jgi:hypothetical protein
VTIEKVVENLSVSERSASIDYVAACTTCCLLCVLGTEFPFERLTFLRQVQRVRNVGYGVMMYIVLPITSGCPS